MPSSNKASDLVILATYQVNVDNEIILLLDDSTLSANLPNLETGNCSIVGYASVTLALLPH